MRSPKASAAPLYAPFQVGGWSVDPLASRMHCEGETVYLEPKVMQVLYCLAAHAGDIVSKEQVMEGVWAGSVVTGDVLARAISELRKGYNDDARNPVFIETIRSVGYRLIAPVRMPSSPAPPRGPSSVGRGVLRRVRRGVGLWLVPGALLLGLAGFLFFRISPTSVPPTPVPLTSYPGSEGHPALSPDGKQLAFVWMGPEGDNMDVYAKLLGTETPLRLTTDPAPDLYPVWSPDGQSLSDGEPIRITHDERDIAGMVWDVRGQHLVFSSNRTGLFRLWRVSVQGGEPALMLGGDQEMLFPTLSQETGRLAYVQQAEDTNIWRLHLGVDTSDTVSVTRVIASTRQDVAPQYAPDGRHVAFASNRSGPYEIWVSRVDGRQSRKLTNFGGAYVGQPRWAPDGEALAFEVRREGKTDLFAVSAAGGIPQRLTHSAADDRFAWSSPDGNALYFSSNRTGTWEIWTVAGTGGEARQVTETGGFGPQVSPDGTMLYYTKREERGLWQQPIVGGDETQLFDALYAEDAGNWAVTERGIFFVSRQPTAIGYYAFETGDVRTFYTPSAFIPGPRSALSVSPDGQSVLFMQIDAREHDIMLVDKMP